MSGILGALKNLYTRFIVWLGAEPPEDFEKPADKKAWPKEYTTKAGDTLFSVGRHFGVHYDLIAKANGIEQYNMVRPGQTLVIPAPDWKPEQEPPPSTQVEEPLAKLKDTKPVPPVSALAADETPTQIDTKPTAPPVVRDEKLPMVPDKDEKLPVAVEDEDLPDWLVGVEPDTQPQPDEEVPQEEETPPSELVEEVRAEEKVSPEEMPSAAKAPLPDEPAKPAPAGAVQEMLPDFVAPDAAIAPPEEALFRYEIQRGDTLNGIARRYGVPVKELVEANDIVDPNRIFPGQKLVIPGYKLPQPEPEPEVSPTPKPIPEPDEKFVYTVNSGDTIGSIAKRYGSTVQELIEANNLTEASLLRVGQKLIIPGVIKSREPAPPSALPEAIPTPKPISSTDPNFQPLGPANAIRALYVSYFAIGHAEFRERIFELLQNTELNAVVIDVKSDYGWITYPTRISTAREIGAARPSITDFNEVMDKLKAQGIYTIARIVTFKDNPLARSYPEYAVKTREGSVWQDHENLSWTDPFLRPIWDYNILIATEAAHLGFDEIQFDALRFPTTSQAGTPYFSQQVTKETRVAAIISFLSAARGELRALGVKMAAATFGYTCWRKDDTIIGQDIERMAQYLDVLCPMLYPSTFGSGIPDYKLAIAHPYEVVYESASRAVHRVRSYGCTVRPWIQDFQDYRFDKRTYGREEIQAQIRGCFDSGSNGFLVWNPQAKYTSSAYAPTAVLA